MEMTNKKGLSFTTNQPKKTTTPSYASTVTLTLQETEALTNILLMSPYLGATGESVLVKLTNTLKCHKD